MTPPPARRRRAAARGGTPAHNLPRRGAVRRAQAITTYGVGSLIAVDQESFIVSGLDEAEQSWSGDESPQIHERRLARVLGVDYFRLPPASDDTSKDGLRVRRFPLMHSCPECTELQRHGDFNPPTGRSICGTCEVDLVPSRFVVACESGHLGEFPYWQWVHRSTDRDSTPIGQCGGRLKLRSSGRTSSLRSILVSCTCGRASEVSMEGSFRRNALKDLGLKCRGPRPWLGTSAPAQECGLPLRTLQRGSSSVWQPVLKSALSIPPWSSGRADPLAEHWDALRQYDSREHVEIYLKGAFKGGECPVPLDEVMTLLAAEREEDPDNEAVGTFDHRYRALRNKEYERLCAGNDESEHTRDEQFVCETPLGEQRVLDPLGVTGPMLVKKLREVRALKAFTRLIDAESTTDSKEMPLSERPLRWLPAMEVRGEGVFLRLDEVRLGAWEKGPAVAARVERIRTAHGRVLEQRADDPSRAVPSPATPRMVLLHTLAHVLINEWSLEAGYPAASLRERLYAADDMAGLLIYTATSDSAGSLGGLVAQGEPELLDATVRSAVHRAEWCSSDPLCMESESSGTGGTNLAACHACVMLPETSCEHNNILLDRALLVGTPNDPHVGYFATMPGH
ncbi:DrmB family protein [Streptomyces sp. Marseille-Q5077]|uniref:DrmB family protein n=1 Tax=Streptomyces sp. Marseille-Q5077 TaxID=3418995 RepID=UPI003D00608B